jgi:hypothetical protein
MLTMTILVLGHCTKHYMLLGRLQQFTYSRFEACLEKGRGNFIAKSGIKGWAEEWYYIHQCASQPPSHPASQLDRLTYQNIQSGISQQPLIRNSSSLGNQTKIKKLS